MESKPMELPDEWVERIETNAKRISGHQPDEDSSPFRNGLYSGYKSGANAYAPWLYTAQINYAALQAKCEALEKERYETRLALRTLLKVFSKTAKSAEQAKFYLQADYILDKYHSVADVLRNEALSAGEGESGMPHLAEPILSYEDLKAWEQSKKEDKE